jgi:hydrogenase maturation protein HypF
MSQLGFPVVATSGNLSEEPICTDEYEAIKKLRGIADLFLVHDRPIARQVDDSIVRVMMGRELVLRRSRGYAPLPVHLTRPVPSMLAVGGHLKNSPAIATGRNIFISQHIGDMETPETFEAFRKTVESFQTLYRALPEKIVCDMHPDYLSTKYAGEWDVPTVKVQHHHAHAASCMAENGLEGRVLAVAWDGTGFGPDGTIWGGEFFLTDQAPFRRVASFRKFNLPGGAKAVKEPRRTAIGLLYKIFGDAVLDRDDLYPVGSFSAAERKILRRMLSKDLNSPPTSSAGRLFDAMASIAGIRQRIEFEGQAAMELEFAAEDERTDGFYTFQIDKAVGAIHGSPLSSEAPLQIVDWETTVLDILSDLKRGASAGILSAKFHNTMVEIILNVARRTGEECVVLTGGCFQNRYLTERAVHRLKADGFRPYWHRRVPPNDGGIALGQIFAVLEAMKKTVPVTADCEANG